VSDRQTIEERFGLTVDRRDSYAGYQLYVLRDPIDTHANINERDTLFGEVASDKAPRGPVIHSNENEVAIIQLMHVGLINAHWVTFDADAHAAVDVPKMVRLLSSSVRFID